MTALSVKPNTAEWLKERKLYIGASDAPAILGLTPNWRSARDVAKDKMTDFEPVMEEENKFFKRGHVLEPLVKYMYMEKTGYELVDAPMYKHDTYSWMSATPDAWINGDGFEALLECKTANRYTRHDWVDVHDEDGDEYFVVPLKYWVQVQHQMAVINQDKVYVAVMFAGEDLFDMLVQMLESGEDLGRVYKLAKDVVEFEVIEVGRDEEFITKLIKIESEFWSSVESGVLPVELKYMSDSGAVRVANYDEECMLTDLKTSYLQKLLAEEDFEECARRVREAIGQDSGIYSDFIGKVTYRKSRAKRTTNWKSLAQDVMAKYVQAGEQDELTSRYTTVSDVSRRFCFPYQYWKQN